MAQSSRQKKRDGIAKPEKAKSGSYQQWSVKDPAQTKQQQAASLFAEYGVLPRYSGKKNAFYLTIQKQAQTAKPDVAEEVAA